MPAQNTKTTRQSIEELTAIVMEMRDAPVMNGGFHDLRDTVNTMGREFMVMREGVARLDERSKSAEVVEAKRHGETIKWRDATDSKLDRTDEKLDTVCNRVTALEAQDLGNIVKIFAEKWWIVILAIIVTIGAWIGVNYEQITGFMDAVMGG